MAFDLNYLAMVIFLLLGFMANAPFLVRSVRDASSKSELSKALPSAPAMLITTSFSELCWVLPCLAQCAISLFNGDGGAWAPIQEKSGCDIMATYSIFASMSGMSSTVAVAAFTYFTTLKGPGAISARTSVLVGAGVLLGSALFASLPALGVGTFWYTGSGFCYLNFYDAPLAVLNLLFVGPALMLTIFFLGSTIRHGGWPSQLDLILMLVAFLSAWTWWVPASFIGLSGASFPSWYFPPIGFLAHGQALINPYLVGIRWRRSALQLAAAARDNAQKKPTDGTSISSGETSLEIQVTPSAHSMTSAPPSPPESECEAPYIV